MLKSFKKFLSRKRNKKKNKNIPTQESTPASIETNHTNTNMAIAICNQKGGCAKTTTAINISSCLAQKGYRVLLIDLDPQAHATLGLGLDNESCENTVYDVLTAKSDLDTVLQKSIIDNLDIAPSNSLLSGAHIELAPVFGREVILKTALQKLAEKRKYDYIFFDCSPTLNLVTINALAASRYVLIPTQPHYFSLEGMKELFSTLDIVRQRLNFELRVLGILPTIFDKRWKISHQLLSELREYFQTTVLKTVIRNNVKLFEAPNYKKPIHLYAPNSHGAKDYWSLTEEVLNLTHEQRAAEQKSSTILKVQQKTISSK